MIRWSKFFWNLRQISRWNLRIKKVLLVIISVEFIMRFGKFRRAIDGLQ